MGDLDQQTVADLMTELVVDRLEAVEIQVAHGEHLADPARARDGLLQTIGEQASIGHAGQLVVMRDVIEFRFVRLEHADVGEHADVVLAPCRAHP